MKLFGCSVAKAKQNETVKLRVVHYRVKVSVHTKLTSLVIFEPD